MTQSGSFRLDLYYRLNVFPIYVPPLRERGEDIIVLAHHFLQRFAHQYGKEITGLSAQTQEILRQHTWSGNVRELENCMERAVLLTLQDTVEPTALPPSMNQKQPDILRHKEEGLKARLEYLESQIIEEALRESYGNMAKAARTLQLTERIIGLRVKKYNIDIYSFKS